VVNGGKSFSNIAHWHPVAAMYWIASQGDAISAILTAAGHNMRLLARWIRLLFALLVAIILGRTPKNPVEHQLAIAA